MRKRKRGRKLSRKRDQRKALLKALTSALFLYEKIKTTEAKAKEIAMVGEKFITRAKKGGVVSTRLLSRFFAPAVVKKLTSDIAPRFKERQGGYTRIFKTGRRDSDGAKMAIIELIK